MNVLTHWQGTLTVRSLLALLDETITITNILPKMYHPYLLLSAAAAHKVNVRHINSTTVGVSFGEAITREDTEALLSGKS